MCLFKICAFKQMKEKVEEDKQNKLKAKGLKSQRFLKTNIWKTVSQQTP